MDELIDGYLNSKLETSSIITDHQFKSINENLENELF